MKNLFRSFPINKSIINYFYLFLLQSIYNTNIRIDDDTLDNRTNSKTVKFDASKRHVDERLNKVIDQFSRDKNRGASYDRDDEYDEDEVRRYGRGGGHKVGTREGGGGGRSSHGKNTYEDEDDDDDIVAMMDRMNRK